MTTRFVFFDLGNVLVRFSVQRLLEQISTLVRADPEAIREAYFDDLGIQQRFETGMINQDEYYELICEKLGTRPKKEDLFHAINDIFWPNDDVLSFAEALAKHDIPRGVLSNVGPEHWNYCSLNYPKIIELIPNHHILSYRVHEMKPSPKIYEIAFNIAQTAVPGIKRTEVLFIDDLSPNVEAAKQFGIDAVLYCGDSETLRNAFAERNLPVCTVIGMDSTLRPQ